MCLFKDTAVQRRTRCRMPMPVCVVLCQNNQQQIKESVHIHIPNKRFGIFIWNHRCLRIRKRWATGHSSTYPCFFPVSWEWVICINPWVWNSIFLWQTPLDYICIWIIRTLVCMYSASLCDSYEILHLKGITWWSSTSSQTERMFLFISSP